MGDMIFWGKYYKYIHYLAIELRGYGVYLEQEGDCVGF